MDSDLLYQVLTLGFFILGPILPAYLLYKIAPDDKILANGSFAGFKINATGATAVFIVLFAALYPKINPVFDSLANYEKEKVAADSAAMHRVWKVVLNVKLMQDKTHPVDRADYERYIKDDSIMAFPKPIWYDNEDQNVVFYVSNDEFTPQGIANGSLVLRNGFGTAQFVIDKKMEDQLHKGTIIISDSVIKPATQSYRSSVGASGMRNVTGFAITESSSKPPSVKQ
jgi:hypothetical protein